MYFIAKEEFKNLPKEMRKEHLIISRYPQQEEFFRFINIELPEYDKFYIIFGTKEERESFVKLRRNFFDADAATFHLPKEIREKIIRIMLNWKVINKSPYSDSFYNSYDIKWGEKPEGSYRISDHWNFYSNGEKHCELEETEEYLEDKWLFCEYRNGKYHIVEEL